MDDLNPIAEMAKAFDEAIAVGRKEERSRLRGLVEAVVAIRDDNGYEIGIDRQAVLKLLD